MFQSSRKKKKTDFVPYRDSVLTWLLRENLGKLFCRDDFLAKCVNTEYGWNLARNNLSPEGCTKFNGHILLDL